MNAEVKPEPNTNANDPIIEQFQTLQNGWEDSIQDWITKQKQKSS